MTAHLDDEALSAALDGEASAEQQAHVTSCRHCRDGLAALAEVARAVGAPVVPRPAAEVAGAVARALASRTEQPSRAAERPTPARAPRPAVGPVAVAAGRGRAGQPRSVRWLVPAAGLAAAVVVALGLVALFHRSTTSQRNTTGALAPTAGPPPAQAGATAGTAGAGSTELGDQSDPVALAAVVRARLGLPLGAGSASTRRQAPASVGATPTTGLDSRADHGFQAPNIPCSESGPGAAGLVAGPPQVPVLAATVRWRGQPAEVLVYSGPTGLAGAVMRTADCFRLAVVPF